MTWKLSSLSCPQISSPLHGGNWSLSLLLWSLHDHHRHNCLVVDTTVPMATHRNLVIRFSYALHLTINFTIVPLPYHQDLLYHFSRNSGNNTLYYSSFSHQVLKLLLHQHLHLDESHSRITAFTLWDPNVYFYKNARLRCLATDFLCRMFFIPAYLNFDSSPVSSKTFNGFVTK